MASDAHVTLIGRCRGNEAIGRTRVCFLKAFASQTEVSSFLVFCWASSFRRRQEEAWALRRSRSLWFVWFTEIKNGKKMTSFSVFDSSTCWLLECHSRPEPGDFYSSSVRWSDSVSLIQNISVEFCQEATSFLCRRWPPHTRPLLQLVQIVLCFCSAALMLSLK